MLMLMLAIGLPHVHSEKVTEIVAPLAKTIPTADAFLTEGEWDDAAVVTVGNSKFGGYLLVKHNWTYLWVYLDCPTDTIQSPLGWDNGWVAIDPDMSGGNKPQEYDILFHSHGHLVYIGDGVEPIDTGPWDGHSGKSQWGVLRGHLPEDTPEKYRDMRDVVIAYYAGSGPGWAPTEASETFHRYWEFRIPLSILDLIPGLDNITKFGFCASMEDYDKSRIADWPVTKSTGDFWPGPDAPQGTYAPPDSWGTLTLGTTQLAEKPEWPQLPSPPLEIPYLYIAIVAVAAIVVVSVVVLRVKRRKQTASKPKEA